MNVKEELCTNVVKLYQPDALLNKETSRVFSKNFNNKISLTTMLNLFDSFAGGQRESLLLLLLQRVAAPRSLSGCVGVVSTQGPHSVQPAMDAVYRTNFPLDGSLWGSLEVM